MLQAAQLFNDLMQEHKDVAVCEQSIERVWVLYQRRCIRDVDSTSSGLCV